MFALLLEVALYPEQRNYNVQGYFLPALAKFTDS
jgi:hypothetical protein